MNTTKINHVIILTFALLLSACSGADVLRPSDRVHLAGLADEKQDKGRQIYRGDVFPAFANKQQYVYERWVVESDNRIITNHTTFTMNNKKLVVQSASEDKARQLVHYDETHLQKGYSGSIVVDKDTVRIFRRFQGKDEIRIEALTRPVVVGPTLFGYIQRNWESLSGGTDHEINFGLIERLETFGFTIKFISKDANEAHFILTPTNFLMKPFVNDLKIDFDVNTKRVIRYKGPVPQYRIVDGDFKKVTATSIYKYTE